MKERSDNKVLVKAIGTDLMEAVVQGKRVVPQQFLFLCAEEPLPHCETRPGHSRCVVLNIELVRELIRSQFAH